MSLNRELCSGCPLDGIYEPLESRGPEEAKYLIVTDTPSQASARDDRLITKYQTQVLATKLEEVGFDRSDFRFTPACHCAFDPDAHVTKVKSAALKQCRQHFLREVETHTIEAIIPLGAAATSQAFGKTTKITKVRGMVTQSEELGVPIFPLMSPALIVMYPQNEPVFNADIASLSRSVNAGYDVAAAASQQLGEYEIVEDLQFLIDMHPEVIAFDTENTGLRWYQTGTNVRNYKPTLHKNRAFFQPRFQILTMQFAVEEGKGYMLVWDHPENPIPEERKPKLRNQLRQLLCNPDTLVVAQGAKYDNVALWMTEGIRFKIGGDTLMLATLLDENMPEKNLDILTKVHVPEMGGYADVFNATYDKSRMWEVPLKDLSGYGVGDADATLRLYNRLEAEVMDDEKLWSHYCNVTIPGLNAFAAMETRGMFIDEGNAMADFKQMMITDVARMEAELLDAIPKACKQGIVADFLGRTNSKGQLVNKGKTVADALSFSRTDFLKEVLFNHPKGFRLTPRVFTKTTSKLKDEALREPSTSAKDHLPYFFDECPFTMLLAEYQKDSHLLNTNVIKFEENYIRGGKVRPQYHLHKAVTGRSSSDSPNGQNYPKRGARAKVYREMFIAPPGHFVIELDLSQAELRIAACMSRDKTMIEIYRGGGDIHRATAKIVLGVTDAQWDALPKKEQKDARQKAKACIAKGQLVLTRDRGLIPIEKILLTDFVWDGVEWVKHEGVIYKGYREVITYDGLTATPEHNVLDANGRKISIGQLASEVHGTRIAVGTLKDAAVGFTYDHRLGDYSGPLPYGGNDMQGMRGSKDDARRQHTGREDHGMSLPTSSEALQYTTLEKGKSESSDYWGKVRRYKAALQQPKERGVPQLRGAGGQAAIQEPRSVHSVRTGGDATRGLLRAGDRQGRQQRELRAGESTSDNQTAEPAQQENISTDRLQRSQNQCDRPLHEHTSGLPHVPLWSELDVQNVPRTGDDGGANSHPRYAHVYDIVNAGPRHIFTVQGKLVFNCNFGFLYGMGWRKFIVYAKTSYDVVFTEAEAKRVRTGFFTKYKALPQWHDAMRNFAQAHKYVRSLSGRIRHLPMIDSTEEYIQQEAGRQSINSPVQEFGSSLGVMTLGRANEEIDPSAMQIVGFIHDAIVAYVPYEYLDWGMKTLKRYMQTNPVREWFGIDLKVPIIADAGFGLNLGEVHECEGFSLDVPFDYTSLVDKDGKLLIEVPPQRTPPNNGRLVRSVYTTAEDLEAEDVVTKPARIRMVRAGVSAVVEKRMTRSSKQMVINRRNKAAKHAEEQAVRIGLVVRRTRPT